MLTWRGGEIARLGETGQGKSEETPRLCARKQQLAHHFIHSCTSDVVVHLHVRKGSFEDDFALACLTLLQSGSASKDVVQRILGRPLGEAGYETR